MGATIAALTALAVFWLTAFVGEDYRRARDAKALAAALAGEVESYKAAMEIGAKTARSLLAILGAGKTLPKRAIPAAPVSIFEANLERIGVLGLAIGRDLPFTYHMINTYRAFMVAAMSSDDPIEQKGDVLVALQMAGSANDVLPRLLSALQKRASRPWRPFRY